MDKVKISIPSKKLAELCQRYHIRKLAFFGSVLRDDFNPTSDVDVLVEFEEGHTPGLGFIDIQDDLSKLLGGREVDLVTPKFLNHRIKDRVLMEARVAYSLTVHDSTRGKIARRDHGSLPIKSTV
ncbi:MAG TPA: nucleotidyltransferase family protein [Anaerolineales bacterium]|nr:nucleotidyltransferase family protein [Anaerolineales bacterium]